MRSNATLKNSIWGIVQQVLVCVLSMFSRRVMLDTIGVEGVGLNAFLTSVITMLSLAELGIGTAIVYHMYAPLAEGDTDRITKLLRFYKQIYRAIAGAILLIGLSLLPFMDKIVSDVSYSNGYVCAIFLLFLLNTTLSYLFTYKRSLISADQKQYIIIIYDLVYKIATILVGILVLLLTRELAYYLIMLTVFTVAENILISKKADTLYPYIKENRGSLEKGEKLQIAKDVRHIFVGKVSGVITNSTDSILINTLVGTIQNGLYSNYNIIIGTLSSTVKQFSSAMRGSVGNLIAVETPERVDKVLNRLLFIMFLIGSFFAVCLSGLIDPFITLIFGNGLLLDRATVYICIANLYIATADAPMSNVIVAAGLFKYDKYIAIAGSFVNLVISFVLGKRIGMTGILIGTTCTLVIQFVFKVVVFYKKYLKRSFVQTLLKSALFAAVTVAEIVLVIFISGFVHMKNPYAEFVVLALLSASVPIAAACGLFFKTDGFQYSLQIAKNAAAKVCRKL